MLSRRCLAEVADASDRDKDLASRRLPVLVDDDAAEWVERDEDK